MFKKDFLYQIKHFFFASLLLQVLVINLNFYLKEATADFYQIIYLWMLFLIVFYPAILFEMISPKIGGYYNAHVITAQLPYSKKQLMWMGLKPWLIIGPLYLIGMAAMMAYFRTQSFNIEFIEMLFGGLLLALIGILVIGGFTLQIITSQIIYLVKQYSWIKMSAVLVALNILYAVIVLISLFIFNISLDTIGWQYVAVLGYMTLSVAFFLPNLKKIEMIYQ